MKIIPFNRLNLIRISLLIFDYTCDQQLIYIQLIFQIRFSMFLFTVMSVSRCIQLIKPFYPLRTKPIITSLITYLAILVGMFMYPLLVCHETLTYHLIYFQRIGLVDVTIHISSFSQMTASQVLIILCYDLITTFLPIVPTLGSCILTGLELSKTRNRAQSMGNEEVAREKRSCAITVFLLTITTLACFLPRTILAISFLTQDVTIMDKLYNMGDEAVYLLGYILTTGLALANSSINPLIFLVRGRSIRRFCISGFVGCGKRRGVMMVTRTRVTDISPALQRFNTADRGPIFNNHVTDSAL